MMAAKTCGHHPDLLCGCGVTEPATDAEQKAMAEQFFKDAAPFPPQVTGNPKTGTRRASYLSPHQLRRLDLACLPLRQAFPDHGPYLVGSVLERADFRDVDVRVILVDEQWDAMFPGAKVHPDGGAHDGDDEGTVRWQILCSTISHWLSDVSGLPVDFQIQRMTQANSYGPYEGKVRNPLGVRSWVRA